MGSSVTKETVATSNVITDTLQINGVKTDKIITELQQGDKTNGVVTAKALAMWIDKLVSLSNTIDPNGDYLRELITISTPLNKSPYFTTDEDWLLNGWDIIPEVGLTITGSDEDNRATLKNANIFTSTGIYYIICDAEVPYGTIELQLNHFTLDRIRSTGIWGCEIIIKDAINDEVSFVSRKTPNSNAVTIHSCKVVKITERMYEYIKYKVKSLAEVDVDNFVPRTEFETTLDEYEKQFIALTNQYLEQLQAHRVAKNPHSITPEMIGAAVEDHTHEEYATKKQIGVILADQLTNYALKDHTHTEYLTDDDAKKYIEETLSNRIQELTTTDRLVVAQAPVGILPSRYAQLDISTPLTVLIPSTVAHHGNSSYDIEYGIVATNDSRWMANSPRVFSPYGELADVGYPTEPHSFRIFFQTSHVIQGYRIHTAHAIPTSWKVYLGNTTFVHNVENQEFVQQDDEYVCEIYFESELTTDSISFVFLSTQVLDTDEWGLKIELLYSDVDLSVFYITDKELQFTVPQNGSNRVAVKEATNGLVKITPPSQTPDIPLYVFGIKYPDRSYVEFDTTYIPPEYSSTPRGINVLEDKYNDIDTAFEEGRETLTHPAYGKLIMTSGHSADDVSLNLLYNSSEDSWRSDGQDEVIIFEQTFNDRPVVLRGYILSWRLSDADRIPSAWTLTIEGVNDEGAQRITVVDSIDEYYPFYSVEDDDIVYHASISAPILAKKLILTLHGKLGKDHGIAINQLQFYINEYYYSIPKNVMYHGLTPICAQCLGSAYLEEDTGWHVINPVYGKSCTIPVNHLERTNSFTEYTVPNPFHSTDVTVSIQSYALQDTDEEPSAYVTNIGTEEITMYSSKPYVYALTISRNW